MAATKRENLGKCKFCREVSEGLEKSGNSTQNANISERNKEIIFGLVLVL